MIILAFICLMLCMTRCHGEGSLKGYAEDKASNHIQPQPIRAAPWKLYGWVIRKIIKWRGEGVGWRRDNSDQLKWGGGSTIYPPTHNILWTSPKCLEIWCQTSRKLHKVLLELISPPTIPQICLNNLRACKKYSPQIEYSRLRKYRLRML